MLNSLLANMVIQLAWKVWETLAEFYSLGALLVVIRLYLLLNLAVKQFQVLLKR